MNRFLVRAHIPENEEEEHIKHSEKLFKVKEIDGLYYEKPNWIDKFFRLGNLLDYICPSHMVKMYDPATKRNKRPDEEDDNVEEDYDLLSSDQPDTVKKYGNEAKFHHFITSNGEPGKLLPNIIELENPCPGEPKFLKKRKHPKALRFFKPNVENNPARYFQQELMLYTSFDEKTSDDQHDDDQCIKTYLEKEEEIKAIKQQVMEWLEDVEEARHYVEEV